MGADHYSVVYVKYFTDLLSGLLVQVKLKFFYDKRTECISTPEHLEVLRDILQDHRYSDACKLLKDQLRTAIDQYPSVWEHGYNSCLLTTSGYKEITIRSYWWSSYIVISFNDLVGLIDAWEKFISNKKLETSYTVEIKELLFNK